MATLIIDRSNIEVRSDGAALAVYEAGERRGSVPLKLLDRVVLQGTIPVQARGAGAILGIHDPLHANEAWLDPGRACRDREGR